MIDARRKLIETSNKIMWQVWSGKVRKPKLFDGKRRGTK
jgi:hypothetical protein